jgi:lysophospholipase L1-like esterase
MGWFEHQFSQGGNGYYRGDPNFRALTDQVAESHPDVVVVSGGLVDATDPAYNPDAVAAAVFDTYRTLRDRLPNARIIAVGPTTPYSISARIVQVDADVQAAAGAVSAQYISLLVPPVITPDMVDSDGVHPNDAGHAAIADRILAAL